MITCTSKGKAIVAYPHSLSSLHPSTLSLHPPYPKHAYPKHGREQHKANEDVHPGGQRFYTGRKGHPNKAGRPIGSVGTEDRNFREFFGAGPFVVAKLWILMMDQDLIPPDGEIKHLMWTLHFLKAYPRQGAVCSTVGGSSGAIDPKTFCKYMWPFIHAMANLESVLVIILC